MLFADTSALFAALVRSDDHHDEAARVEAETRQRGERLWTVDPVLTELWALLWRAVEGRRADGLVRGLLESGLVREPISTEDYARSWQYGEHWADQGFSLTDRQAFAVMERTGRLRAWSYDKDFRVVRLGPRHDRALDIVR